MTITPSKPLMTITPSKPFTCQPDFLNLKVIGGPFKP
jgi:hypothetical protein